MFAYEKLHFNDVGGTGFSFINKMGMPELLVDWRRKTDLISRTSNDLGDNIVTIHAYFKLDSIYGPFVCFHSYL